MDFAQQQRSLTNRFGGITFVVLLHALLIYALVNGLARKVVTVLKGPLETKIIQELKPPPPEAPPPPPKLTSPPPSFIPPPEVNIAEAPAAQSTITAVTRMVPSPVTAPAEVPKAPMHVPPVVRAKSCREPHYPASSARMGESGKVVLSLLIGVDGRVVDSKVE